MLPSGALRAHTSHLLLRGAECKRSVGERARFFFSGSRALEVGLFDEERFAKLIAPYKRFHRPVAPEQVLDLAILIYALRGTKDGNRDYLQRT